MRAAPTSDSTYAQSSPRRRLIGIALAALANLLLILLLLGLAPPFSELADTAQKLVTFNVAPEQQVSSVDARSKRVSGGGSPKRKLTDPVAPAPTPPAPPAQSITDADLDIMIVSREVFAASDISRLPQQARRQTADLGGSGSGSGSASGDSVGAGTGPNGQRLFNAQWYREPSDAELNYYLRSPPPTGSWATIACRTIPNFRVEDCVELADSPPGSGLARAMRQAAGGFLVRPPRIGGKVLVGEWVRIRIEFTTIRK
jgi:hypothetical protein